MLNRGSMVISDPCYQEGIIFCPFVMDTFGAWDDRAAHETKHLGVGQSLTRSSGQPDSEVLSHLFQRLAVLLMRESAILLKNRIPNTVNPWINGDQ